MQEKRQKKFQTPPLAPPLGWEGSLRDDAKKYSALSLESAEYLLCRMGFYLASGLGMVSKSVGSG